MYDQNSYTMLKSMLVLLLLTGMNLTLSNASELNNSINNYSTNTELKTMQILSYSLDDYDYNEGVHVTYFAFSGPNCTGYSWIIYDPSEVIDSDAESVMIVYSYGGRVCYFVYDVWY
jgi:hypothetical protein